VKGPYTWAVSKNVTPAFHGGPDERDAVLSVDGGPQAVAQAHAAEAES